jgi:hypothetical protein
MPKLLYGYPVDEVGRHRIAGYGEIYYIDLPRGRIKILNDFQSKWLVKADIPYYGKKYLHKKMVQPLSDAIREVVETSKWDPEYSYWFEHLSIYCPRHVWRKKDKPLSRHAFALAVDVNPWENPPGERGAIPICVAEVFEKHGFTWGGRWRRKRDDMHFQLKT